MVTSGILDLKMASGKSTDYCSKILTWNISVAKQPTQSKPCLLTETMILCLGQS